MKKKAKRKKQKPAHYWKGHLVKMSDEVYTQIQERADKVAGGNISALLRHAGMNYRLKSGEKISS